jgi:hypothetical protein
MSEETVCRGSTMLNMASSGSAPAKQPSKTTDPFEDDFVDWNSYLDELPPSPRRTVVSVYIPEHSEEQ